MSAKGKRQPEKRPRKPAISVKRVQATEDQPPPKTSILADAGPEVDDDPWDGDGLTFKQRRFCELYVSEAAGNATKAARLAGYRDDNYRALITTACQNLKRPQVRGYIARLLAQIGVTPESLKSKLAALSASSMDNFLTIDDAGEVVLDMKQAAALGALGQLKEFREETTELGENVVKRRVTVKVHDPLPATRTLAEMLGILVQQHNHTLNGPKGYVGVSPDDWDDRSTAAADDARRN